MSVHNISIINTAIPKVHLATKLEIDPNQISTSSDIEVKETDVTREAQTRSLIDSLILNADIIKCECTELNPKTCLSIVHERITDASFLCARILISPFNKSCQLIRIENKALRFTATDFEDALAQLAIRMPQAVKIPSNSMHIACRVLHKRNLATHEASLHITSRSHLRYPLQLYYNTKQFTLKNQKQVKSHNYLEHHFPPLAHVMQEQYQALMKNISNITTIKILSSTQEYNYQWVNYIDDRNHTSTSIISLPGFKQTNIIITKQKKEKYNPKRDAKNEAKELKQIV